MLRAVLTIVLVILIGGIAFYAGRATAPPRAYTPPPDSPPSDTSTRTRTVDPPPSPPQITTPPVAAELPQELGNAPDSVLAASPVKAPNDLGYRIGFPIAGYPQSDIHDSFSQARARGERAHEATDLMAARGTPVVAVTTGLIKKLFDSKQGGLTVYQFDSAEEYCFYYAHLDRYEEGLREGQLVKQGDRVGYVGSTGNANPEAPHLHFAIFKLGPERRWHEGTPLNPYPILMQAAR